MVVVDRPRLDRESSLAEHPYRAGHVPGGGHQQPALRGLGLNQRTHEDGVLPSVAGLVLEQEPVALLKAEITEDRSRRVRSDLGRREQFGGAAGEGDLRLGIAACEGYSLCEALARLVQRMGFALDPEARVLGPAEHDDAVDIGPREIGPRKALLERQEKPVADGQQSPAKQEADARRQQATPRLVAASLSRTAAAIVRTSSSPDGCTKNQKIFAG